MRDVSTLRFSIRLQTLPWLLMNICIVSFSGQLDSSEKGWNEASQTMRKKENQVIKNFSRYPLSKNYGIL